MKSFINFIDRYFYHNFENNWDNEIFRQKILEKLDPDYELLDYGCGRGLVKQMNFKQIVKSVDGIDPDPICKENPFVHNAHVLDEEMLSSNKPLPFEDNSFDIVFSCNVFEHIESPIPVLKELNRIVKKNGSVYIKTSNRLHYVGILARLTPFWFHRFYNKLRNRDIDDTFPTFYSFNSIADIKEVVSKTEFDVKSIVTVEGRPEYLRISFITYIFGLIFERIVNLHPGFSIFRCVIIVELQKVK